MAKRATKKKKAPARKKAPRQKSAADLPISPQREGQLASDKMGRPPIEIDVKQVTQLAQIGCTDEEIGSVLGCSTDTIGRRKKADPTFADAIEKGRAIRRSSLRRKQTEVAEAGNVTMLIWLGKQELDQTDRHDLRHGGKPGEPVQVQVIRIGKHAIKF